MTDSDTYPLSSRALEVFGERHQFLALSEELAEASAAVSRLLNNKGDNLDLVSELVDVESVIASVRYLLAKEEVWSEIRAEKRAKLRFAIQHKRKTDL